MGEAGNLRGIKIHPTLAKEYVAVKATTRLKLEDLIEFVTRGDHGAPRAEATQKNLQSRLVQVFTWSAYGGYCSAELSLGLEQEAQPRHLPGARRGLADQAADRWCARCVPG